MPYTKTVWVDGSSPDLDAANLNNIETGISKAPYGPDATANQVPVWNGTQWVYQQLTATQISATAGIAKSQLAALGIVDADVAAGAAIAKSKLAALNIADADVAAAAGIALSKLAGYPSDSTKFARGDGTWAVPPGGITSYRKTTAKAVNTTTSATDLLNGEITLAANVMGTTKRLTAMLEGDILIDAAGAAPRLQLVVGGTTVIDTGAPAANVTVSTTRGGWKVLIECLELGATNAQAWNLHLLVNMSGLAATTPIVFTTGNGSYNQVAGQAEAEGTTTTTIDTTASQTLAVKVINGVSSANYETRLLGASVDIT